MKLLPSIILIGLLHSVSNGADVVLPYGSFGPQAIAHELIGMEWWQWDSHGDSRPREYPIKVVVYWDQTLQKTKKQYPIDRSKEQDFRYVEYTSAVNHLEKSIKNLKNSRLDSSVLEKTLIRLRSARVKTEQDIAPSDR